MLYGISGSARATTNGAIGPSGVPVRVFAAALNPTGTVAGIFTLNNGTTSGATTFATISNSRGDAASAGQVVFFGNEGILFSSGCFYVHGTSNESVVFQFRVEK